VLGVSLSATNALSKSGMIGAYESGHFSLWPSEGHSNEEVDWELFQHKLKPGHGVRDLIDRIPPGVDRINVAIF
jgi:hypothetical protein